MNLVHVTDHFLSGKINIFIKTFNYSLWAGGRICPPFPYEYEEGDYEFSNHFAFILLSGTINILMMSLNYDF